MASRGRKHRVAHSNRRNKNAASENDENESRMKMLGMALLLSRLQNVDDDENSDDSTNYDYDGNYRGYINNYGYDDYDEDDDEDDDDDDDARQFFKRSNKGRKLAKIAPIYFKLNKIKKDPIKFTNDFFSRHKARIQTHHTCYSLLFMSDDEKVNKANEDLRRMIGQLDAAEKICISKFKQIKSTVKSRTLKLIKLLDGPKKNLGKIIKKYANIHRDFNALKCKILSGFLVRFKTHVELDTDDVFGELIIRNCYDYKKSNELGEQVDIEKCEGELIYYLESTIDKPVRDMYESNRLPYMLTKFTHSEHVIELLKLFGMLEVPKPTEYKLDDIQKRFDAMEKIQAIPSEDYFKEKDKRGDRMSARSVCVEFLIGLLIGKFENKTEQEHTQIEAIIELILRSWRVVGVRMRRHVLNIVRASCEWINEESMVKFEDLVDDAEMNDEIDHDYNSDEMAEKLFEEHSSESDDSSYENPDDTESDSDEDDSY